MDRPRAPREEELDGLLNLLCEVWPHFRRRYTEECLQSAIRRRVHRCDARVIVEEGQVVSNIQVLKNEVSVYGCRFKVAGMGCVCTREDRRDQGLAGAVLEHSMGELAAAGTRLLYVSGDRSLYRRNHCVHAGRFFEAEVRAEALPGSSVGLTARRIGSNEWGTVAPLHQGESVRFVRKLDFLSETCFWWDEAYPEIWLIEGGSEPLAYVVLEPPWEGGPEDATRVASEYAGSRAALVDGLPAVCEAAAVSRVKLRAAWQDRELKHMLARLGITLKSVALPGHTIRILDLPGLMRDLRPYLAARLARADLRRLSFEQQPERPPAGGTCVLRYEDEGVKLDLSQAARLILGGPEAPRVPGELGRVLSAVFPVPIPVPGLNYL